ncbi:MAG TPA: hypothetical protein VN580_10300, partial [Clostridia bacterium]|nr:hypothetical protein [Clostridia bacterium]
MRSRGIAFKLWASIIAMTMALLVFILIFQTEFLYDFYYEQEREQLEKDCIRLSSYVARGQYNFTIPYYSVMRRVNDMIIVTDREGKITYVEGTNVYKLGDYFGLKFIGKILNGENVYEKNKMIRNPYSVWPKEMETLLVGVPVRQLSSYTQGSKELQGEKYSGAQIKKPEISEVIYLITTLEYMQTTIDAIRN